MGFNPKNINFIILIGCVLCVVVIGLLSAAVKEQGWIDYTFVDTNVQSSTLVTVTTVVSTIGIWDTCVTTVSVTTLTLFGVSASTTTNSYKCLDTKDTGYFSEEMIIAARSLGIMSTLLMFFAALFGVCRAFIPLLRKHIVFGILPIVISGFAFLIMMIALILLNDKKLTGMTIAKCFKWSIAADVLCFVIVIVFSVGLALDKNLFNNNQIQQASDREELAMTSADKKRPVTGATTLTDVHM